MLEVIDTFVLLVLRDIISAPLGWFSSLMARTKLVPFYISMVFLFVLYNRILKPLFGSAGSDKVKKPTSAKNEKDV